MNAQNTQSPSVEQSAVVLPPLPPFGIDVFRIKGFKAAQMEQYGRDAVALNRAPANSAGEVGLEARFRAVVRWLEANQPDVFRRGLWDVINGAAGQEGGAA